MPLTERQRNQLRHILETVMRADDVAMTIADERSTSGHEREDEDLEALHDALTEAIGRLEQLLAGS